MAENWYYPVYLDLRGRRCIVIGGGSAAQDKVMPLLRSGAQVEVLSPSCTEELHSLAQGRKLTWHPRRYRPGDLEGAFLAIVTDTADGELNLAVRKEADERRCLLNVADMPGLCHWIAPAVIRRGPVIVAVSTGGLSPALSRRLREDLDRSPERGADCCIAWADAGDLLGEVRADLRARRVAVPAEHWQACLTRDVLELCQRGQRDQARQVLTERLEAGAARQGGSGA